MPTEIQPQPGILDIALYESGKSALAGRSDVLKLSSNENPRGPSPAAVAALRATASDLHRYPATDHAPLRRAIAEMRGLDTDRIICGVGSDEIIALLCYAYAGPGTEVLQTEHGFSLYRISALAAGARPVVARERERVTDVDALLAATTARTRLVFIANPNNPTGTFIPLNEIARLADGLPPHCLLVLDGAYAEFAEGYDGGASLVEARDNIVMTRTFSKLYGLGGLRVGWAYAPRVVIDVLNRLRGPFNLGAPQLAAAEAAVRDTGFVEDTLALNAVQRRRLTEGLRALGIACDESRANFVLARFKSGVEADAADLHLQEAGILVRRVTSYGFPEGLRITVGTEADMTRLLGALGGFVGEAAA
ncbi:MAG: histidinol-phosphate transaminase [Pseudomonadota bacterium]